MSDLVTVLTERLRNVVGWSEVGMPGDWMEILAREALTVVAERLPTREGIVKALSVEYGRLPDGSAYPSVERMADALLRDLRERLGVKP